MTNTLPSTGAALQVRNRRTTIQDLRISGDMEVIMETIEMSARIDAPADLVWKFCGDFGNTQLTRGYVSHVELKGSGIGALRIYHLDKSVGEGFVVERLERLDEDNRIIEHGMIDNDAIPWTDYGGTIQVTPAGPGACTVTIRVRFVPVGVAPEVLARMSRSNIAMYFGNLAEAVRDATALM